MFDQAQRSLWLEDQLWARIRESFPVLKDIPTEVLITVGYPSSGGRGRRSKIKPAEVSYQWQGNPNEKAFIAIHPIYFDSVDNAMKAVLFGAAKFAGGARWGHTKVGVTKEDDGTLTASAETQIILDKLKEEIGEPPSGFGVPFATRESQRTRNIKYVCATKFCSDGTTRHSPIRTANDNWMGQCSVCSNPYAKDE